VDLGLAGSVAVVTGANNPEGIGAAIVEALAREGAHVCVPYLRLAPQAWGVDDASTSHAPGDSRYHAWRAEGHEHVDRRLREQGLTANWLELDLSADTAPDAVFDWAEQAAGPVSILVNNAAHFENNDRLIDLTADGISRTVAVNFRAALLLMGEFARRFKSTGCTGRVINISTDAAQHFAGQVVYGSTKAAIEAATRAAATELGPHGITVNAVAPGPVQTGYITDQAAAALQGTIPLGRVGAPPDIADAAVFLASSRASWITGQIIRVAGGHVM